MLSLSLCVSIFCLWCAVQIAKYICVRVRFLNFTQQNFLRSLTLHISTPICAGVCVFFFLDTFDSARGHRQISGDCTAFSFKRIYKSSLKKETTAYISPYYSCKLPISFLLFFF